MFTSEQMHFTTIIYAEQEIYLQMAEGKPIYKELNKLYTKYQPTFKTFIGSLYDHTSNLICYQAALESRKVDPYVAGGIANGLAGPVAGVVTGTNAAAKNAQIEASRSYYSSQIISSSGNLAGNEYTVLNLAQKIDVLLNSDDEIRAFRANELEAEYQKGLSLLEAPFTERKKYTEAEDTFKSILHYKDSSDQLAIARKKYRNARELTIFLISFVFALILTMLATSSWGHGTVPGAIYILVFFVCFIAGEIGLRLKGGLK